MKKRLRRQRVTRGEDTAGTFAWLDALPSHRSVCLGCAVSIAFGVPLRDAIVRFCLSRCARTCCHAQFHKAEHCRERYSPRTRVMLWLLTEL